MQNAADWLGSRLQDAAGRTLSYERGNTEIESMTGVANQVTYEIIDSDMSVGSTVLSTDWTFKAAELVIGGNEIEPRPGDIITEVLRGNAVAYEVVGIGTRPCFEFLDSSGILLLVHSKRID